MFYPHNEQLCGTNVVKYTLGSVKVFLTLPLSVLSEVSLLPCGNLYF